MLGTRTLGIASLGLAFAFFAPATDAEIFVDVPDVQLLPDTPGQTFQVFVTTDANDQVQGINFHLQIEDGGPEAGGSVDGPDFTDLDIITGSIWEGNNNGESLGKTTLPGIVIDGTTTQTGAVLAQGLIGTVTVDTTGFFSGTFDLLASNTLNGPLDFGGVEATIDDGSLTIVPEPASLALMGLGALLIGRKRRRA